MNVCSYRGPMFKSHIHREVESIEVRVHDLLCEHFPGPDMVEGCKLLTAYILLHPKVLR